MATVAQSHSTVNFDTALRTATARAKAAYPAETCRIERGLAIALAGGVTLRADGTALVDSQTHPDRFYKETMHVIYPALKGEACRSRHNRDCLTVPERRRFMQHLTLPAAHSRLSAGLMNGCARANTSDGPPGGEYPLASTGTERYRSPCLAWYVHRQHQGPEASARQRRCRVAMNRHDCSSLFGTSTTSLCGCLSRGNWPGAGQPSFTPGLKSGIPRRNV